MALAGAGAYLAWFAVHYWRSDVRWPTEPVKAVLTGKPLPAPGTPPPHAQDAALQQDSTPGTTAGGSGQGAKIAAAALAYAGQGYVWGGPADKPGDWDCSSFVSYVLGHDLGLPLPGGGRYGDPGYPPHAHGPTTLTYMLFGTTVNQGSEQPGDLVVSAEHMGIVTGGGQMISAQDPQLGTGTGSYPAGFPGGPPVYRRVP